ncbi:hypothetical protein [Aeromonas hydrophila]|uniref:hypothetical protein n=1 Tax=Aeromonas hydrophila TaxID=644 RepID=UPI000760464E|nr:hypothetical protein [Aeromonas hydrophila]KWR65833.1 SAM-dependent methyltransferase [Aeromonas hydrophila]HAU4929250.1 SAM-dependent methyltransferase [Aeromonas hydrophila]
MQADFLDAHARHWDDAESLLQAQRWANADHLYGMAAECGLKKLMLVFGMPYDTVKDRPTNFHDRVHANGVWARFQSYSNGRANYVLPAQDPFSNWDVSDRYAKQSDFDSTRATEHKAGAQLVCDLIKQAERDGWI